MQITGSSSFLSFLIKKISGFEGELIFNTDKPDGTPRKLLDVTKLHESGWHHKIELEEGIRMVHDAIKDTHWD